MKRKLIAVDEPVIQPLGLLDKLRIKLNIQHAKLFRLVDSALVTNFIALPEKLRTPEVAKMYFEISSASVPAIYNEIPDRFKTEDITNIAISKCHMNLISFYNSLSESLKTPLVTLTAIHNVSDKPYHYTYGAKSLDSGIPELYSYIPEQSKTVEVVKALELKIMDELRSAETNANEISRLYANMPSRLQTEPVTRVAITRASSSMIPQLYAALPSKLKNDVEIIKGTISRLTGSILLSFYASLPEELKMTEDIVKQALQKIDLSNAGGLIAIIPHELQIMDSMSDLISSYKNAKAMINEIITNTSKSGFRPESYQDVVGEHSEEVPGYWEYSSGGSGEVYNVWREATVTTVYAYDTKYKDTPGYSTGDLSGAVKKLSVLSEDLRNKVISEIAKTDSELADGLRNGFK